eukprot:scaffold78078_cov42-Phaeocystis_antarctica.AAC.1
MQAVRPAGDGSPKALRNNVFKGALRDCHINHTAFKLTNTLTPDAGCHPVRSLSAKNDPKPKTLRGRPAGRHVRLRRPDLIATAAESMDAFDLVSKERVNTLRPACRSKRPSPEQRPA